MSKKDRAAFKSDLDRVFYASSESAARKAWHTLEHWSRSHPSAVELIEKDLDDTDDPCLYVIPIRRLLGSVSS